MGEPVVEFRASQRSSAIAGVKLSYPVCTEQREREPALRECSATR